MKDSDQNHDNHYKKGDDRKQKAKGAGACKGQKPVLKKILYRKKNAL